MLEAVEFLVIEIVWGDGVAGNFCMEASFSTLTFVRNPFLFLNVESPLSAQMPFPVKYYKMFHAISFLINASI